MINFLLLTLACYAISYNLVNKDGPWDTIKNLRSLIGIIDKVETVESSYGILITNTTRQVENNVLAKLFSCQICLSGWFCIVGSGLFYFFPEIVILAYPLAMWGVIIILVEKQS